MQILKLISRIALLLLCINCTVSMAQTNKQKKAELDSLENLLTPSQKDSLMELLAILEQDNPKNTLDVSVNVANAQLSKTNLLTNKSVTYNGLLVTPNITFTLINGINIT
jgi:cytochrome bd-type quinol oxidase subunit 1